MLKVKDNVDLKELEKYGFRVNQYKTWEDKIAYDMVKDLDYGDTRIEANCICRHLTINLDYNKEILTDDLDILYDLIKDDLIEKVDE